MSIQVGQAVEHNADRALGQGKVSSVDWVAGVMRVGVRWSNRPGLHEHTAEELLVIQTLPDRLRDVGPAVRIPFQLKVLARWFEERHSLTGELSNQPFQMLPHQVVVTNRVVNSPPDRRAWLIADDVGLGKTIEAGMIIEVLRKKTLGRFRCLVITPAGLMPQWKDELAHRFARQFRVFESHVPNDLETVDQLIASIDTLKTKRLLDAITAATPWDVVIVDEAHHLATVPSVLAYRLVQQLRDQSKARSLLFLTATPHSGKNDHFFNMLRLLRKDLFQGSASDYPNVSLKQVMIRNRKSDVTDVKRNRIFKGIAPAKIIPFEPTAEEVEFFEELREYLRTGYRVAERLQKEKEGKKASAVGFLMTTFGKLAASSRAAIQQALENRRGVLLGGDGADPIETEGDARFAGEQAAKLTASAARDVAIATGKGKKKKKENLLEDEQQQVDGLLERLNALKTGDTKLVSFLQLVKKLPSDVKLLIFTEYRATQDALVESLRKAFGADSVATIHGSMNMAQRREQVEDFNEKRPNPRFMVSTEAGGEGLNMQKSCHTIVNYDLPWNPMVLQQRIGRVYRYGQTQPVVVFNIKVESPSEAFADQRVYSYLEKKIEEITRRLQEVQDGGVEDVREEVLGQIASQLPFDELYRLAVEEGHKRAQNEIDDKTGHIAQILADPKGMLGIFKGLERFDITDYEKVAARVDTAHIDFFVRQYLGSQGVRVQRGTDKLISFRPPKSLIDVANAVAKADPYQVHETLTDAPIERATVDKEHAQQELKCRLLRFGDVAFEAMVRHAQHGGFSSGAATLELPAARLGWASGTEGTWVLLDLRIVRQEGSSGGAAGGTRVLRNELASYLVPRGEAPSLNDRIVEALHDAADGPLSVDADEAARAYGVARSMADQRLKSLYEEVVREFETKQAILPLEIQDVAIAWVRAG